MFKWLSKTIDRRRRRLGRSMIRDDAPWMSQEERDRIDAVVQKYLDCETPEDLYGRVEGPITCDKLCCQSLGLVAFYFEDERYKAHCKCFADYDIEPCGTVRSGDWWYDNRSCVWVEYNGTGTHYNRLFSSGRSVLRHKKVWAKMILKKKGRVYLGITEDAAQAIKDN